jgi:hypothetical protein
MSDCSLTMPNPDVHIPYDYKGEMGCYRIILSQNIALPAMSETFTLANLTKTAAHGLSTKTGIVEPSRQFESTIRVLVAKHLSQIVMKIESQLDF